jgi:hypothetical protein
MNLVELIIWVFSVFLAIGLAVLGYNWFGLLGAVGGLVVGIFVGLCVGVGTAKLCYRPRPRKKRPSSTS